jgi:hypothetical protein
VAWWTAVGTSTRDIWRRFRGPWSPNDPQLGGTTFGWSIVGMAAALLGPAIVIAWALGSYFRLDIAASISMIGNEGRCDLDVTGIGVHCFSDYTSIYFDSPFQALVYYEQLYPVATRLVRLPFWGVGEIFGLHASLIVFLLVAAVGMALPALWAVRHSPWWAKAVVVTVLGIATAPFLFAWDRGNIVMLAVPFLFLAMLGLVKDKPWWVVVGVIVAATIKPQFALLGFALLARGDWRRALAAVGGSVVVVVGAYALLGAAGPAALVAWIQEALGWSDARELFWSWPGNGSIPRALYLVTHLGPWADSGALAAVPDSVYRYVGQGYFVALVIGLLAVGRRLPPLAVGAGLIVIAAFILSLSLGYYFVVVLPVVAIAFRRGLEGFPLVGARAKVIIASFAVALVLSITPLIVPILPVHNPVPGTLVIGSVVPSFAILAWTVFLTALVVHGVAETIAARRRVAVPEPTT